MQIKGSVTMRIILVCKRAQRGSEPSSVVRTFTDRDQYFAGIQNLRSEDLVMRRGKSRAEATRIDRHWLWIHRFNEDIPDHEIYA
jgi:hypothetical protein